MLAPLLDGWQYVTLFVLYNCLAFVSQPLVGWWVDGRGQEVQAGRLYASLLTVGCMSGIGVLLFLAPAEGGSFLVSCLCLMVAMLVGAGNALFHVMAGKDVTIRSGNDMRHLGIFVSSGALGLLLGSSFASMWLSLVLVCVVWGLEGIAHLRIRTVSVSDNPCSTDRRFRLPTVLCLLLLVVFFRSFLGKLVPASANEVAGYALWLAILTFLGKATGGFFARRVGAWHLLTLALLVACGAFLMGYYHVGFLLLMVFCINQTMPLTLHLANRYLPHREGLAFGLLAGILLPGFGLGVWCYGQPWADALLYPLIATLLIESLVLLLWGERRWQVLGMTVVMNVLTNVPLNLLALFVLGEGIEVWHVVVLEGTVVMVEALLYRVVTRSWRRAIVYSLVCNLASYLLGLAYQLIFL